MSPETLPPDAEPARVRLAIDALQIRRRTTVVLNGAPVALQARLFLFLLRLVVASRRRRSPWVSRLELRIEAQPETPSRLRVAVASAMPAGVELVESDGNGRCRLHALVDVERIDCEALLDHPHETVRQLVSELQSIETPLGIKSTSPSNPPTAASNAA